MKKKKDRTKALYYVIACGCLFLFLMLCLSSLLDIGERLRNISVYLEYSFYVIFVLVFVLLIIRPIYIILKSPSLSIATSLEQNDPKVYSIYKKVSKNIIKNNNLKDDDLMLLTKYNSKEELLVNLQFVFENSVKPDLNKIIINEAKTVMISTAICQSARFDMVTVFAVNLKIIKNIVEKPSIEEAPSNFINTGIYIFNQDILDKIDETELSLRGEYEITDSLQLQIDDGKQVMGFITDKK